MKFIQILFILQTNFIWNVFILERENKIKKRFCGLTTSWITQKEPIAVFCCFSPWPFFTKQLLQVSFMVYFLKTSELNLNERFQIMKLYLPFIRLHYLHSMIIYSYEIRFVKTIHINKQLSICESYRQYMYSCEFAQILKAATLGLGDSNEMRMLTSPQFISCQVWFKSNDTTSILTNKIKNTERRTSQQQTICTSRFPPTVMQNNEITSSRGSPNYWCNNWRLYRCLVFVVFRQTLISASQCCGLLLTSLVGDNTAL